MAFAAWHAARFFLPVFPASVVHLLLSAVQLGTHIPEERVEAFPRFPLLCTQQFSGNLPILGALNHQCVGGLKKLSNSSCTWSDLVRSCCRCRMSSSMQGLLDSSFSEFSTIQVSEARGSLVPHDRQ